MAANNVVELVVKLRDQITQPLDNVKRRLGGLGGIVAGLSGVASAGAAFTKIISETIDAERAVFQLDQAYRVFGQTVGVTRESVLAFSNAAQQITIFSGTDITRAQAALLQFSSVVGTTFERARQIVLDYAATTGQSLESAATTIGRAIERPSLALRQLRDVGLVFSREQEQLIRNLESTGQTAQASEILLGELEKRLRGTAEAARNTLGGALSSLKNAFEDLFEAADGGNALTQAINDLTNVISDPALRGAIQSVGAEMLRWLAATLNLINLAIKGWRELFNLFSNAVARVVVGETDPVRRLSEELRRWREIKRSVDITGTAERRAEVNAEIKRIEDLLAAMRQRRAQQQALSRLVPAPDIQFPTAAIPSEAAQGTGSLWPFVRDWKKTEVGIEFEANSRWLERMAEAQERVLTDTQRTAAEYQRLADTLAQDVNEGLITAEQRSAKLADELDRVLQPVITTARRVAVPLSAAQERLRELADSIGAGIGNAISQGGLNGLTSLREIVKQALRNILADIVSSGISNALKRQFAVATAGGGGGLLGSLFSGLGALFGFGRAGGGLSSGWTLVGETGPELVRAPVGRSMRIYSRAQLEPMLGRQAQPVVINSSPQLIVQGDVSERNQALILSAMERTHARSMREIYQRLAANGVRLR